MLNKNGLRPAYAVSGNYESRTSRQSSDHIKFRAASSDDELGNYRALGSESRRQNTYSRPPQRKNDRTIEIPLSLIITAVAVLAVIVLAVIIIASVASSGSDIEFSDNSYVVYTDAEGNTCINVNGKPLDATFEGKISIRESADRSFAYVEETNGKRHNIYVLNGKTMEPITISPVNVLAYAEYQPAVVYEDGGDVYVYTEKYGEEIITDNETALNFKFAISGDGSTVVYNETDVENGNKVHMFMFTCGKSSEKVATGCYPAFDNINSTSPVSYDGSYIYCYGFTKSAGQKKLYVVDVKDSFKKTAVGEGVFGGISAMNKDGDEIIYYTVSEKENISHIYNVKKNVSNNIAKGFFHPVSADSDIACFDSFKGVYLQNASSEKEGSTYYINNKYVPSKIAAFVGTFSPDGDYFYYVNDEKTLIQIDLGDKKLSSTRILSDVSDYAVTKKGNIYILDADSTLRFHEVGDNKKSTISKSVTKIVMYDYANTLYFEESDSVAIYSSKEGSTKDSVEFDKAALTGLPTFMHPQSSDTYVTVYDEDIGWKLLYTSNGRKFKLIASNCEIAD